MIIFADRQDAGMRLAAVVAQLPARDPLVLALPRGGVAVAAPVAMRLGAPLDVWVVRKVGSPLSGELGVGAVGEGGEVLVDRVLAHAAGASDDDIERAVSARQAEVAAGVARLRGGRPRPRLEGRTVIVVDDGVANGVTARCAVRDIRRRGAARVIFATPVGATDVMRRIEQECDGVVCLGPLGFLGSVGAHYDDFRRLDDDEVQRLLEGSVETVLPVA